MPIPPCTTGTFIHLLDLLLKALNIMEAVLRRLLMLFQELTEKLFQAAVNIFFVDGHAVIQVAVRGFLVHPRGQNCIHVEAEAQLQFSHLLLERLNAAVAVPAIGLFLLLLVLLLLLLCSFSVDGVHVGHFCIQGGLGVGDLTH